MLRSITCSTSFEGIHCWPEAPDDVAYLRNPHRHIFHIMAEIGVKHNDRDVEFIMAKHHIDAWIKFQLHNGVYEMGRQSCEDVAELLVQWIENRYPKRSISVSVFEDGENGCTVSNFA